MKYESDFYVGYLPVPARLRRRLRHIVAAVVSTGALIAVALIAAQGPFAPAIFEFGKTSQAEGVLIERPYPALIVPAGPPWLLAGTGKHGVADAVRGLNGRAVMATGSRVWRGPDRMLEVGRVIDLGPGTTEKPANVGQSITLRGEIVDTKCFFGVMNPGNGKVHRDCAARCIAGGIPPGFLVRDSTHGSLRTIVLAGPNGGPLNSEILDYVAEPVTISGVLIDDNGRLVLRADPRQLRHPE